MLIKVSPSQLLTSFTVEGSRKDPIRLVVGDGVSSPFVVLRELAMPSGAIVLRIDDLFYQILWFAIDNKRWRWALLSVLEGVKIFGVQLGDVKDSVDANSGRETKYKGHT